MSLSHPPLEEQEQQQHSLTYTTRGSLSFHSIQLHSLALPRRIHPFRVRDRVSGSGGSSGSIRSSVAVVDS